MKKTFPLDLTVAERQLLWHGTRLLDQGEAFEAHECFERAFRASQGAVQTFFRGLTQLCASYHQLQRGRGRAARSTRAKAFRNLALVDLLSFEFQKRVDSLFDQLGAHEGCARFIETGEAKTLRTWPVPDTLRPSDGSAWLGSGGFMAGKEEPVTHQGFNAALGLVLLKMDASQVTAELPISAQHHQPWGIVHGGVYCSIVETICSIGAQAAVQEPDKLIVGIDNHTSFLKATRNGTLRALARPLVVGRRTQLWEANIHNDAGELVATGRVRLMVVDAGKPLAGAPAGHLSGG